MRIEKSIQDLIESVKNCVKQIEREHVRTDQQLVSWISQYLSSNNYEIRTKVQMPQVISEINGKKGKKMLSGIVVRVSEGYVPIEVKLDGSIQDYKHYITKIQIFVQSYQDVPCSLAMFLSRKQTDENVYNLSWKRSSIDSHYKYIIAKYANYRANNKIFVRKNSDTAKLSSIWNH